MFSMLRKVLNVTYLCITLPCSEHVIACSGRVITCRSTLRQIPTPVTHSLSRSKWRLFFPLPEFTLVNNNDEDWQEVQDSAQVREEEEEDEGENRRVESIQHQNPLPSPSTSTVIDDLASPFTTTIHFQSG